MSEPVELMPTELLKDGWAAQDQVYEPGWWLQRYWDSTAGSHRDAIIKALESIVGLSSVFEIGCNVGPNLRRIHQRWPGVALSGMDIHAGAIQFGRDAARAEGWAWSGYVGDLRELGLLGTDVADVVLSCYSLYVDPRDINTVLAAALACATKALILCEPMVVGDDTDELYVRPTKGVVAEYHYNLQGRLMRLPGAHTCHLDPITPPHQRLQHVLTVVKG